MFIQWARSNCIRGVLRAWEVIEGSLESRRDTRSVEASGRIGTSVMRLEIS